MFADLFRDPLALTRRHFLHGGLGLGSMALAGLKLRGENEGSGLVPQSPTFAPKAKRVIYLFQSGGPAQQDLYDDKPLLREKNGQDLPESVRRGQRLTAMSVNQASYPLAGSVFRFHRHGRCGMNLSELLPHTGSIADEICLIRSVYTEAINHDPAITFLQTGSQIAGRPSLGAWVGYGLGTLEQNLPAFVVLVTKNKGDQPLYARLWGSGFLDSRYQGVKFSAGKDPVYYLSNPEGAPAQSRRSLLQAIQNLDREQQKQVDDPELDSRISQYEMAYRLQSSIPDLADLSQEPESVLNLYGPDAKTPGTFAYNCVLARRLAERGVRFIQLYHQGWDQHGGLPGAIRVQTRETDQPSAGLIKDLKSRGLLDDTLVIWGGEFGRTSYSQGKLTPGNYGRDHHPRCFSAWMAGGGIKQGFVHGQTDAYGYNIADENGDPINPDKHSYTPGAVHVHDLQATILHLLGMDHERLTYKFQGRRYRLTDVHGHVIKEILA